MQGRTIRSHPRFRAWAQPFPSLHSAITLRPAGGGRGSNPPPCYQSFFRQGYGGGLLPPHRILVLSLSLLSLGEHGGQILGLDNRQNVDFAGVSSNLPLPDNSSTAEGRNVLQDSSFGTLRLSAKRNVPQPPVHLILSLPCFLPSFVVSFHCTQRLKVRPPLSFEVHVHRSIALCLSVTLFCLRVKGAGQAPRPIGPPSVYGAFGGSQYTDPGKTSFARGVVGSCLPTARELLPNMENCIPQQLGSSKAFGISEYIKQKHSTIVRWYKQVVADALSSLHPGVQGAGEGFRHRKVRSCCEALWGGRETPQSPVKRYGSAVCGNKKKEMDDALSLISLSLSPSCLLACTVLGVGQQRYTFVRVRSTSV